MRFTKYLLVILLFSYLSWIKTSKLNAGSNSNLEIKSNSNSIKTSSLQVFKDKELTNKVFSFEGISFDFIKVKDENRGLKINISQMKNKENADNFFDKIGKKNSDVYSIYYSSLPGCDVLHKINPSINLDVIQIGLFNKDSEEFFITINFEGKGEDQDKYTKIIHDDCIKYGEKLKQMMNQFYQLSQKYFLTKKEKENLKEKSKNLEEDNKKNSIDLENVNSEKKVIADKIANDKKELDKIKAISDELKNKLVRKYGDLNNKKAEKAKNEDELSKLNKKLEEINKISEEKKNSINQIEKQKEEKRSELKNKNDSYKQIQKNIDKMDQSIKNQKDEVNKLEEKINKISSNILKGETLIADNKIKINEEQTNIDNIQNKDTANTYYENFKNVDQLKKKLDELKKELVIINKDLEISNIKVNKNSDELKKILNDPSNKVNSKKEEANNLLTELKEYLDNTKKVFPLLPDIYWDNIWRMINVHHSEGINYIKGMRPSFYNLYDYLYTKRHPEKTINDVDFIPQELPKVSFRRLKKRRINK